MNVRVPFVSRRRVQNWCLYLIVLWSVLITANLFLKWPVVQLLIGRQNQEDHQRLTFVSAGNDGMNPVARHVTTDADATRGVFQKPVELVICIRTGDDLRQASALLKTILRYRKTAFILNVVVFGSDRAFNIVSTLFNTWELDEVTIKIHRSPKELGQDQLRPLTKFLLFRHLPEHLEKILYLSNNVRLLDDVGQLWRSFVEESERSVDSWMFTVASEESTKSRCDADLTLCRSLNVLGVNLRQLRRSELSLKHSPTDVKQFLYDNRNRVSYSLDRCWLVDLETTSPKSCSATMGVLWSSEVMNSDPGDSTREAIRQTIQSTVKATPTVGNSPLETSSSSTANSDLKVETCAEFRRAASAKRRTHLCFASTGSSGGDDWTENNAEASPPPSSATSNVDVTLATQLTLDRFSGLERLLGAWTGPASVTLYVTDDEAEMVDGKIARSEALKDRKRTVYHVVYKRLSFNPINYLRNVAVNNSCTTYVFYVDVDLTPNPTIYSQLLSHIKKLMSTNENNDERLALVVPAFKAEKNVDIPANKAKLLELIKDDLVSGYGMKRKWRLGHQPTNFTYWMTAQQSYCVQYHDAFEPYVVVSSADFVPRFNENFLERFADKAMFIRTLHAHGFKLCVLPDVFVLHLPHETSSVYDLLKTNPAYSRCATIITEEYKHELARRYEKVVFR